MGIVVFVVVLIVGFFSRAYTAFSTPISPALTVVGLPTETLELNEISDATATVMPTSSPTAPPSPSESFLIGHWVVVSGTGGDGLRLRNEPGLSAVISFLAYENEVFQVEGGPQDRDGYTWWFLVNPYDNSKSGWAAANYLRTMESQ
ncbi:MAG: hypothetical protein GTO14_15380 [Anaerolineales bacterium]|nr:hypothetical protein [Anaerolineales bacterium]